VNLEQMAGRMRLTSTTGAGRDRHPPVAGQRSSSRSVCAPVLRGAALEKSKYSVSEPSSIR
jgi:hypothetical protein